MEKTLRKSYYCNNEIGDLIKKYSSDMGISESAFISICVDNYHTQRVAINTMSNLEDIVARLERLETSKGNV
ncbi:MAG: hypothetical protein E6677_05190 [Finegoldia magna]|nr:hypothetical protein [Finegoldia magna]